MPLRIEASFHEATNSLTYLIWDEATKRAAIVDPVLDFDSRGARTSTGFIDRIIARVRELGLTLDWILETHVHADHLSAAQRVKAELGGKLAIGRDVGAVQKHFAPLFGCADGVRNGGGFDRLLNDGERLPLGGESIEVMATPGHTPACVSYHVADAVFVGDTMFMPDYGTARCDFPGGDARQLYRSIRRVLALPERTRLYMCHDYKAPGRDVFAWECTVADQRARNVHIKDGVDEEAYVAMRTGRDRTLSPPALILPALQVNICAGKLPEPDAGGVRHLRLPLNCL